jgi:Sec-independent protein secretion pathway component TatC
LQVAGYSGLLLAAPTVLYEIIAYVVPGLTKAERKFLAPIVFGSSILFYIGCVGCAAACYAYVIAARAALLLAVLCCACSDTPLGPLRWLEYNAHWHALCVVTL